MEPSRTTLVFDEEHFAMEVDESVADVLYRFCAEAAGFERFLIVQQFVCPFLYFRLCVELRTEPIDIVIMRLQGVLFGPFGVIA